MDERNSVDIGRWVALSERFADEGEMNLSKLLDAAAYAQVRRSGWMHRPVVTRATMAQELDLGIERQRALEQLRPDDGTRRLRARVRTRS